MDGGATHKDSRVGLRLQPEWFEVDFMQSPLVNHTVVASSQMFLLVPNKV
jgi:hypothetical protein